jgi:hypothetical protein
MSGTTPTPVLHTSNILGSPGTTFVSIWAALQVIGPLISNTTLPTTGVGWINLGLAIAVAVVGALAKG